MYVIQTNITKIITKFHFTIAFLYELIRKYVSAALKKKKCSISYLYSKGPLEVSIQKIGLNLSCCYFYCVI